MDRPGILRKEGKYSKRDLLSSSPPPTESSRVPHPCGHEGDDDDDRGNTEIANDASAPPQSLEQRYERLLLDAVGLDGLDALPVFDVHNRSPKQLAEARYILDRVKTRFGFLEPDRGDLTDTRTFWREGRPPDYTVTNLQYMLGKTQNHPAGSLELHVENVIKTWEMEATHKLFQDWTTVNHRRYRVRSNGAKTFGSDEAAFVGNYNWLLSAVKNKELYDSESQTFESSHGVFRYAFPEGFPFEVLRVLSPPPRLAFSWHHWARFSGEFRGRKGNGEVVHMTGFGVIDLDEDGKVCMLEIYFDPDSFLETLMRNGKVEEKDRSSRHEETGNVGKHDDDDVDGAEDSPGTSTEAAAAVGADEQVAAFGEPVVMTILRRESVTLGDGGDGTECEKDGGGAKCPFGGAGGSPSNARIGGGCPFSGLK